MSLDVLNRRANEMARDRRDGAPNMSRPGADLIGYYLDPDQLQVAGRWSRKHVHTQRRLCERFAAPVIGTVTTGTECMT